MPKVVKIQEINYSAIVSILKKGGVIIYPTDTAYAIGCDARDQEAVKAIFEIKGRNQSKALPLIASDISMVRQWCELAGQAEELADKYWPGPLTLVLPVKQEGLSGDVRHEGTVAIRVPGNKIARDLSRECGAPIVSTSANKSGDKNPYSLEEVRASLGEAMEKVNRVIDAGPLPPHGVSTLARLERGKIEVIRPGIVNLIINQ